VRKNGEPLPGVPPTDITYSGTMGEMEAARAWGLTPDEWYRKPRWARAVMVAQVEERSKINWWANPPDLPEMKNG